MALDGITIACMAKELNEALAGARIAKIAQPEPDELLITTKSVKGQRRLVLSASASLPLVYFTQKNKQSPMTAPNFCMLLRKHIGSGRILRVVQPSLERVLRFEIEHYDELGDLCTKVLILELMGKYSNLIFCDDQDHILDAIKHISAQTSSVREVLPGRPYFIPQTQEKLDPLTAGDFSAIFTKGMPLAKAIYTSLTGISPVAAEELCVRAGLDSSKSAKDITKEEQLHLLRNLSELMEDVREGRFTPNIVYDADNLPVEFAAIPLSMYSDLTSRPFDSPSLMLETYYDEKASITRIRQKSADLRRVVNTILERESRKLDLQEKQLRDTQKREKFRIYGELLHTYGYSALPGADSITVPNYYDNDKEIKIPLDPTRSASENAKRYFEKYDKQKRTFEVLSELIRDTRAQVEQLTSVKTFLEQAQTEADLSQIREELVHSDFIHKKGPAQRKGASRPEKARPYHYRTEDGYDLYIGKNNLQNEEVTFRLANSGDWWFHAKKVPGSHVIVKGRGDGELPDHIFELAASAAAYYSSSREADKVEIDYVQRREVKKPGGSRPGFVIYHTNYSMVVKPDISKLTLCE